MGKKKQLEENANYEVWISKITGWEQVVENGNDGIFTSKTRALTL